MSRGDTPPALTPRDALRLISAPATRERLGPYGDMPYLLVDFTRDGGANSLFASSREFEHARIALSQLACPTLAIATTPDHPIVDAFDVRLASSESQTPVCDGICESPLASLALVQLLRIGDGGAQGLGIHERLVAESLAYSALQAGPEFARWLKAHESSAKAASEVAPESADEEPAVLVECRGGVLELCLNRPAKHNAFSVEIRDGLAEALHAASGELRKIVLSGRGPSFSSGGDLGEFGSLSDPASAHAVRSTRNVARLLLDFQLRMGTRVEVTVHGTCVGAGVELPAFADHVIAREGTTFQLPEIEMGLVPGAGGTASLPQRIGRQRTAQLALSGERIDTRTALSWGIVDEIAA